MPGAASRPRAGRADPTPAVEVRPGGRGAGGARRLRLLVRHALRALGRADREVHLAVVDDRTMRALHRRYRGSGAATDVLAFDLEGPGRLLGEVIVSADAARRQARRLGVPVALELDLLAVHGILHLVGWDDADPVEARLMHQRAREILEGAPGRRPVPGRLWRGLLPPPRGKPRAPGEARGRDPVPAPGASSRAVGGSGGGAAPLPPGTA